MKKLLKLPIISNPSYSSPFVSQSGDISKRFNNGVYGALSIALLVMIFWLVIVPLFLLLTGGF